jgi:DNA modification methylase
MVGALGAIPALYLLFSLWSLCMASRRSISDKRDSTPAARAGLFQPPPIRAPLRSRQITYRDPRELKPRARNPRIHSVRQIQQIAASIEEFGFVNPVLVDGSDGIIAGHGRVEAAKRLGMSDVPTVRVDHLTPPQVRAYVIADNKLAENAGWDLQLLALELQELSVELNFDVSITGFETGEIDFLISEISGDAADKTDQVPEMDRSVPAVSREGDLWHIGKHVLLCGNALRGESYARLLNGKRARMIITDPPYNLAIAGNVSGLGKIKHGEFAMASGEMNRSEFTKFLAITFEHLCVASADGSLHFVFMDWRHMREVLDAAERPYSELKNLCVWTKSNAGMGSLYRSQHELVFVFKNGTAPHLNNVELGRFGRHRSNVWPYAGVNTFGKERDANLAMHPTVKPLALVADAIMDCSKRGDIVLDAFSGSGTTLMAAERTGRRGFGIELDPHYTDVTIRRLEELHGLDAIHADSKRTFESISTVRAPMKRKEHDKQAEQDRMRQGDARRAKDRAR